MNTMMDHDLLMRLIRRFGREERESKQIARRLKDFLPRRLREARPSGAPGTAAAHWRQALTSKQLQEHIEEFVNISFAAREARVQYETHMMLFDARRSLRAVGGKKHGR